MATTNNELLHNYLKTKIDMDGVIPDYMLPVFALQELRKQDKELTALREAGEKMAALLGEDITDDQLTEALDAWKAANK